MRDCPLSKMLDHKIEGLGKNIKVVSGGEDMTQIRGNVADWYAGDNTEYVKPTGIAPYERESYRGGWYKVDHRKSMKNYRRMSETYKEIPVKKIEKEETEEEIVNEGEEIEFLVKPEGRMIRLMAIGPEEDMAIVSSRWTKKALMSWIMLDQERLHDELYNLAEQLAGEEYAIVGTGNRLFLKPAPEQEWIRWQRKQPEEAIVTISFGKITGNNGDRLIRGHVKVHDIEGNLLIHVTEIYDQVTQSLGSERMRLLKLAKAEMEKKMKCDLCDRGQVFFKNAKKMPDKEFARVFEKFCLYGYDPKVVYLATWYPVERNEYGLCNKCFVQEQVWRNSTVETDISIDENVLLKDQLDAEDEIDPLVRGEVTGKKQETTLDRLVHVEDRLNAYEDIEFIASLDRHETNKFLGSGSAECKNESFLWAEANTTKQELEAY